MSAWDLAIIGAGPAGAATAIVAARAGLRTVVLDAAHFPRQKVCGEYLTPAAIRMLEELGVEDVCRRAVSLTAMELTIDARRSLTLNFDDEAHRPRSLSRYAMDARLLDEARRAGATILTGRRVRRVIVEQGRATAVECAGDAEHESGECFSARLIIAADGRRSIVVRDTGHLSYRDSGLLGFKRHVLAAPGSNIVALHALPGGYVGTCPTEDGTMNVCGMMPRQRLRTEHGNVAAALKSWIVDRPELRSYLEADGDGPWHSMPDVSRQSARPIVAGVLYVGDALGTIEPLAGQGMTLALASARLASEWIRRHGVDGIDGAAQQTYAAQWQRQFARPIRMAARFGRLLRNPGLLKAIIFAGRTWPGLTQRLLRGAHRRTLTVGDGI